MLVQFSGEQVFFCGGCVNNYANSGTENRRMLYICLYTVLYKFIANYNYKGFYQKEINLREVAHFPPFTKIRAKSPWYRDSLIPAPMWEAPFPHTE